MTESERERIAKLEIQMEAANARLKDIDEKLGRLLALTNFGRGAWWALLKLGALIAFVLGIWKLAKGLWQ